MKLWKKISLVTAGVLFLAMGVFGGIMLYENWKYNQKQTIEHLVQQMSVKANIINREIGENPLSDFSEVAKISYLNYTMQRYAGSDYMLLKNGEEAINLTNFEWNGIEGLFETQEPSYILQRTDGQHLIIMGQTLANTGRERAVYQLILVRDITELYREVERQLGMFGLLYFVVIFFAVDMVFWLVHMVLKPMADLEQTAIAISEGDYERRIRVRRNDEVGKVSEAFNLMADQVESQILELEEVSERRRLLLGSLTHELKTPMTSIIGYSDTLLHVRISEEQQKRALEHINAECRRLERLSGKLMTLIGLYEEDRVNRTMSSVRELIRRVAEMERYHMKDSGMELRVDSEEWELFMDMDLMESLLVNLLDNAIKASKPGSVIELHGDKGCIWVRDHGKGIPEDEIPKITEAFYMVDKSRSRKAGGIGMGLALVKRIAELHGAHLEIESTLGEGTVIRVLFEEETA